MIKYDIKNMQKSKTILAPIGKSGSKIAIQPFDDKEHDVTTVGFSH